MEAGPQAVPEAPPALEATVCVATFGDRAWIKTAERALASAHRAGATAVVHRHGQTLAKARNACANLAETEWLVYLDADDELRPGYLEAMAAAQADLRAPAVECIKGHRRLRPYMPKVWRHHHECSAECLREGNWLLVGTAVRAAMARAIRWREFSVYEDWDFFQRCWLSGATVQPVPEAIYRMYWRPDSRNHAPPMAAKDRVHREIVAANL